MQGAENGYISEIWGQFVDCLPEAESKNILNPGNRSINQSDFKNLTGFNLPEQLSHIYSLNDGQLKDSGRGIFKAISGHSKYSNPYFLSFEQMTQAWKSLSSKSDLKDVFQKSYLPFAIDKFNVEFADDVYCLDALSGQVFLLWTQAPDWTLPAEFQYAKFERADNLKEFFENQIKLYQKKP